MKIKQDAWYLVRSIAGGSVLLAQSNENSTFPKMSVAKSYDLSSWLCGAGTNEGKDYELHLSYAKESKLGENWAWGDISEEDKDSIRFIERI